MKLILDNNFRNLKKGLEIPIHVGKINTWVGCNGTGKSSVTELLYTSLQKEQPKLKKQCYWKQTTVDKDLAHLEDCPKFSSVYIGSDKLRQVQWIDMDALLDLGIERLKASEGQNCTQDMLQGFSKSTEDTLTIFDETDGHLDYFYKVIFFNNVLPRIKGTVILISHDPVFLADMNVFDFTDFTEKMGKQYYIEMEEKYEAYKTKMEEKSKVEATAIRNRLDALKKKFNEISGENSW